MKKFTIESMLIASLLVPAAEAQTVTGSYQGTIVEDSGLGLLGDIMRIDFSYDDSVSGTPSGNETYFEDFLQSLTLSIGSAQWTYDPDGFSGVFLGNDDVQSFALGVEDRITAFTSGYSGTSLVSGAGNYSFDLYLSDTEPTGAPDGLTDDTALSSVAPDPSRFTGEGLNTMIFSFIVGDPELGSRFSIQTGPISAVAPVPVPAAVWLLGTAVAAAGLRVRRRGA